MTRRKTVTGALHLANDRGRKDITAERQCHEYLHSIAGGQPLNSGQMLAQRLGITKAQRSPNAPATPAS